MKSQRNIKILSIFALVISLIGMAIGFAAFSSTLNISSNAFVVADAADFKMKIYGLVDVEEMTSISNGNEPNLSKWSTSTGMLVSDLVDEAPKGDAVIDNSNFTITIAPSFTEVSYSAGYYFIIKNEGLYDAYVTFPEWFNDMEGEETGRTCIPGLGTTPSLATLACKNVLRFAMVLDSEFNQIESQTKKISPNDYLLLMYGISYPYTTYLADGPITVNFEPVKLNFTTVPSGE